ncbi:hypothetical protein [Sodalis sp.]
MCLNPYQALRRLIDLGDGTRILSFDQQQSAETGLVLVWCY